MTIKDDEEARLASGRLLWQRLTRWRWFLQRAAKEEGREGSEEDGIFVLNSSKLLNVVTHFATL